MAVQIPQLKTIGAVAPESQSRANFQAPDYSRAAAIDQRTVSGVLNSAQQFAEKMESQAVEEKSTEAQKLMAMKMNSDLAGVKDYAGDPTQKFAEMRQEWAKYKDDLIAQKYGDMSSISQSRLKQNLDKTMSHYEIQSSLEESRHYNAWKDQNLQDFTKLTGDSLLSLTQLFEPNQKDPNTGETLPLRDTEGKVRLGSDGKPLYVDPDALDKFNGVMNDNLNKISADLRSKGLIHPGPNGETVIDPSAKLTIKQVVDANVAPAIKALTKDPEKNEVVNTLSLIHI